MQIKWFSITTHIPFLISYKLIKMDFTLKIYRQLLQTLQNQGFSFQTFSEFLECPAPPLTPKGASQPTGASFSSFDHKQALANDSNSRQYPDDLRDGKENSTVSGQSSKPVQSNWKDAEATRDGSSPLEPVPSNREDRGVREEKTIILRHDVDLLPGNSLRFAEIQHEMGIKGSYYFRAVPESWDEEVIRKIAALGHEIGYHYESLTTTNGDMQAGIADFEKHLEALRKLAPVKTICMHGSPKSKWDSKDLWKQYNYHDYGIIGEPYFDVNFDEVFYLTDTGRRWDGWKVSVRDKVPQQEEWVRQGLVFRSTNQIIKAAGEGKLPSPIMFTFHPQRWHSRSFPWLKEFALQNAKNVVKRVLIALG